MMVKIMAHKTNHGNVTLTLAPEFWANIDGNPIPSNKAALMGLAPDFTFAGLPCKCFDCSISRLPLEQDKQNAVETIEDGDAHGELWR